MVICRLVLRHRDADGARFDRSARRGTFLECNRFHQARARREEGIAHSRGGRAVGERARRPSPAGPRLPLRDVLQVWFRLSARQARRSLMNGLADRDEDKGRAAGRTDEQPLDAPEGTRRTRGSSLVASLHGNLRRAFDVLEIEHRLRRLRQRNLYSYLSLFLRFVSFVCVRQFACSLGADTSGATTRFHVPSEKSKSSN